MSCKFSLHYRIAISRVIVALQLETTVPWASAGGNGHLPPWKLGLRDKYI